MRGTALLSVRDKPRFCSRSLGGAEQELCSAPQYSVLPSAPLAVFAAVLSGLTESVAWIDWTWLQLLGCEHFERLCYRNRGISLIHHVKIVLIINPRIGILPVLKQLSAHDKSTAFTILKYGINLNAKALVTVTLCITGHAKLLCCSGPKLSELGFLDWLVGCRDVSSFR